MDKVKILIADDDYRICEAIEKILYENFITVEVVAQTNSVENTIAALNEVKPHIAILDIHLIGGTAIEVFRQTSHLNYKVIFMSAYQEYILDNIRFASIDFIYKPLDINDLIVAVDQVISSLVEEGYRKKIEAFFNNTDTEEKAKEIVFKTNNSLLKARIDDIICGESIYGGSRFHFNSIKPIETSKPLRRYEAMLQSYLFYRCHSHYVINLNHINHLDFMSQTILLSNGMSIQLEKRKMEGLTKRLEKLEVNRPMMSGLNLS